MSKIKVFNYINHLAHNYSLYQIPGLKWYVLENNVRRWIGSVRPKPNFIPVPYYEPGKYDIAIIHLDQQVIDLELGKAKLFRDLIKEIKDIPVIVINHGTPYWMEAWDQGENTRKYPKNVITYEQKLEHQRQVICKEVKELVGDNLMIVNSYEAKKDWGWGEVIIHGIDGNEWYDLPKEPRVVSCVSSGGLDYYYGRDLLINTKNELGLIYGLPLTNIGSDWSIDQHKECDEKGGFHAYRDFLGRSLIYFNPTKRSPMPRSRTEAQLSGCCILTTANHDADKIYNLDTRKLWSDITTVKQYIEWVDLLIDNAIEEINGIIVPDDFRPIGALIDHLIHNRYKDCVKIGHNGKKTAQKMFRKERFDSEWINLLEGVINAKNTR